MDSYDFIIVGAGASGCLLASRLAKALPSYSILLLDAGGKNADRTHQDYGERHWTYMVAPDRNWGYRTVPQPQLQNREIDFSRGKGLGGSTAINFCAYTRGPRTDYDRWAKLVGDSTWRWENTQRRFNKIESFRLPSKDYEPFANVSTSAHGFDGPIHVGFTEKWDPSLGNFLNEIYHYHTRNLDHSSGDPLGISICQIGAFNGRRVNAAEAFLSAQTSNLTVITDAAVTKILFDKKSAIGVELSGSKIFAKQEVILSAGAVDSPKLLLLSGVGPAEALQQHGIPLIRDVPGIGKDMDDHLYLFLVSTQKPEGHNRTSYIDSPAALDEARRQWTKDQSGPLADYYLPQMMAFLKSRKALASEEFKQLDWETQLALLEDTKPTFEILSQIPSPTIKEPERYLCTLIGFLTGSGTGEVRLRSSDPKDHPIIDPKYLSGPFERRAAIEAVRQTLAMLNTPPLSSNRIRYTTAPKGDTDEEILEFIASTASSMWHPCRTVKMGKPEEAGTCVDVNFKVCGLERLRVVDMSVAPLLPSAHTQSVAYLIGETAADKIIAEYT